MTEALRAIIGEFRTLSPDITNIAVFGLDGETVSATDGTTPEQTQTLIRQLKKISNTEGIGSIESFTIQDVNTQLAVKGIGEVYLATVYPRNANPKIIKSLTEVVGPSVISLAFGSVIPGQKTNQETAKVQRHKKAKETIVPKEEPQIIREIIVTQEEPQIPSILEPKSPPEPPQPKSPTTQFMVERIGGILVPPDTVRIDSEVLERWRELEGKLFATVAVETLEGKKVTCKYKPIRASSKGIIQIPDKLLLSLGSSKGKLVMVKPVIQ